MTWLAIDETTGPERDAVLGLAREPWDRFREVVEITWSVTDPELIDLCRLRLAQMMECRHELAGADPERLAKLEQWRDSSAVSEREAAALDYAEQFHLDQNQISEEQKERLQSMLPHGGLADFTAALQTHDAYVRVLTLLDIEPDPRAGVPRATNAAAVPSDPSAVAPATRGTYTWALDPRLSRARAALHKAAGRQTGVDPVTSELSRLRNANHQTCRLCLSGRLVVERPAGVEDLLELVIDYERSALLSERQKVALRLTDAFIAYPGGFSDEQRAAASEHFSAAQVVELLFKLCAWTGNKMLTALGGDKPTDETKLTFFHLSEEGESVRELAAH